MTTEDLSNSSSDKLFAGKFKTVEELEAGYKNSLPTFQENETLKKKLDEVTKVPDDYQTPTEIALHENDLAEAKRMAKSSGMTQNQYEKFVREQNSKSKAQHEAFETAKRELGADKINLLQDYVTKTVAEGLRDTALKKLIMDKGARESALAHRENMLRSSVPGMNRTGSFDYSVTDKDMLKAREEMNNSRGRMREKAKARYLAIQKQLAHQNDKD